MSPVRRYVIACFCWVPFIGATLLAARFSDGMAYALGIATGIVFLVAELYTSLFARCPGCGWRIAAGGKRFLNQHSPRRCPECGYDLDATKSAPVTPP